MVQYYGYCNIKAYANSYIVYAGWASTVVSNSLLFTNALCKIRIDTAD